MKRRFRLCLRSVAFLAAFPLTAAAAQASCEALAGYDTLDFWLGRWVVFQQNKEVGENRIEKVLAGCAILEHWRSASGGKGMSLFYYAPDEAVWKQVWVTDNAARTGGTKEKRHVATLDDGSVRFQGDIAAGEGRSYLDRTTLTPLEADRVRQHIEISTDGGATWRTVFDALYLRPGPG